MRNTLGSSDATPPRWWPRSRELRTELPALLDVLWTACRDVNRVTYSLPFWEPVPRRMQVQQRVVSLRGRRSQDPSLLTLFDSSGREHLAAAERHLP